MRVLVKKNLYLNYRFALLTIILNLSKKESYFQYITTNRCYI